jgi:hypothetical protein
MRTVRRGERRRHSAHARLRWWCMKAVFEDQQFSFQFLRLLGGAV